MRCGSSFIRDLIFLSTPSARRATAANLQQIANVGISIHALREEGDSRKYRGCSDHEAFLSTPSARRATAAERAFQKQMRDFYPRPPRGGRRPDLSRTARQQRISIHALREEGDNQIIQTSAANNDFYPRPPRGGRPRKRWQTAISKRISIHALREEGDGWHPRCILNFSHISIHALREEGDFVPCRLLWEHWDFYPRPPRGGRHGEILKGYQSIHFYPRPPRGGRQRPHYHAIVFGIFLSTPSARRAT